MVKAAVGFSTSTSPWSDILTPYAPVVEGEGFVKGDGRCRWVILQMSTIAVGRLKCVAGHKRKFEGAPRLGSVGGLGQSRRQSEGRGHVSGVPVDRMGLSRIWLAWDYEHQIGSRVFKDINLEL